MKIDTVYASSIEVPLKIEPMKDPTCLRTEYFVPSFAVDGANGSRWMLLPKIVLIHGLWQIWVL